MKTPLTYYGGKQRLADTIIKLFPKHKLYCEPFVGGGAVFFKKEPSGVEVINDINSELVNFYEIVKRDFTYIEKEVEISLHGRDLHRKAMVIYQNPDMFDKIKRAWAVWFLANVGFAGLLGGSYGYGLTKSPAVKLRNKRDSFTADLAIRLQDVDIECADALRIIRSRDSKDSLFYCDPPYINSDQGHYDGYTVEDYTMLLTTLSKIKGKFILSSYPSDILLKFIRRRGWHKRSIDIALLAANHKKEKLQRRTELLVCNYVPEEGKQETK